LLTRHSAAITLVNDEVASPIELASFAVTTAIAVVTAFGAHYGSSFPNVIGWSDALSSFMFGFGLDQLRNTVAPAGGVDNAGAATASVRFCRTTRLVSPNIARSGPFEVRAAAVR
jgi:hypothetical protein